MNGRRDDVSALLIVLIATGLAFGPSPNCVVAQWAAFEDETAARLIADPGVGAADPDEKDFAWGDVDGDGDTDLVIVRKQGWSSSGRRTNVLLLNENGVLVDRTATRASASDVPGDLGFLTPTNDRDVELVDVNGDGLLDIVTAVSLSDGQPRHIGHPRIYVNLGFAGPQWQGFRYESARIPQLLTDGGSAVNPRFQGLAAGDVTGDGAPDLFFVDSDLGGQPAGADINDRLLVNDGNGFFTDDSKAFLTPDMLESWYGTAVEIIDVNGDGFNDIVKNSVPISTFQITVLYNSIFTPNVFDVADAVNQNAPTFFSVGDFNADSLPDLVVTDDGLDRYHINTGTGFDALADFETFALPGPDGGFGGNSVVADLDNDGHVDVIVTDVDNEISGCARVTRFFRNDGAPMPQFVDDVPAGIAVSDRSGVHDAAVFDIDGDGFLDMILGNCTGTHVWMQQPPQAITFAYTPVLPVLVAPDTPSVVHVQIDPIGDVTPDPATAQLWTSIGGAPFSSTPLVDLGGGLYAMTLPAVSCLERIDFYVSIDAVQGGTFTDPADAPSPSYSVTGAIDTSLVVEDPIEGDVTGWSVVNGPTLTSGAWEQADPIGTTVGAVAASPEDDASPGGVLAFVTGVGVVGGAASAADVDGGPTVLTTPPIDLAGTDGIVSYARWFFTDDQGTEFEDALTVEITNDGAQWVPVPEHTTTGTAGAWEAVTLVVGDYVTPSAAVRLRFSVADVPNNSVTEAGIDDLHVERFECLGLPCPADLDGSGAVGFSDVLAVIGAWGPCIACPEDLDGSGDVGFSDVFTLIAAWGPCE